MKLSSSPPEKPTYNLLTSGVYLPRTGRFHQRLATFRDVDHILNAAAKSTYCAVDFETRGGDYSEPSLAIMGIGLAWDTGSCYFHWADLFPGEHNRVRDFLYSHTGLLAHNVYFDGGVALGKWGNHVDWYACTYALLAMTANDGHPGQFWGLKGAMVDFLGWDSSNEADLDKWLVVNGYYRGNKRLDSSPEYLEAEYLSGGLRPDKGEMWRAPKDILGKYCCLDADATYLLFTEVLLPCLERFPDLLKFHQDDFLCLIRLLIEQKMAGILMDRSGLEMRKATLGLEIENYSMQFRSLPEVLPHILAAEEAMIQEGILSKEPARVKKDGTESKNWVNWNQRLEEARSGLHPDYRFNLQSGPQLAKLFYQDLGNPVRILTEKGLPGVGIKALKHLGEPGRLLIERMWCVKELSYIDKYLELTVDRPTIHPSFRTPGTVTGRLSSKEPNMQQIPKTKAMMELFQANSGTVWVDLDFSALEPVVTTEFSQDPNMLAIYGNGRPSNDIYLYVGAHIPGEIGRKIKATGYDPLNPTKEALARAKKECKHERSICKVVALACGYGAGVNKVMQILEEQDVFLEREQVEEIHATYWRVFGGVKGFSKKLQNEWRMNRGYILNGVGRPMAVPENMTQDLLNRFVQSTGHDILVKYVRILSGLLDESGIPWYPVIVDFHDATTVAVPEADGEATVVIFKRAMDQLNIELVGSIQLRGVPVIGKNLSDVKEPEQ